jgi:hypothetical protein
VGIAPVDALHLHALDNHERPVDSPEDSRRLAAATRPAAPTPAELIARAAEVRAGWDEETELRRQGIKPQPYRMPEISLSPEAREIFEGFRD